MLKHAFKEWAVICQALATGRQAFILRKGGIAEANDTFEMEHTRFWLFPTYVHQQRDGIKPDALPHLEQAEKEKPPAGTVRLTHFVEVPGLYHVRALHAALILDHLHLWSEATVRKRFDYRVPGLYVLPARVYQAAQAFEIPDTPHYAGCKSWVELDQELSTEGATPVLDEVAFREIVRSLEGLLNPTALV
ncbi:MAG: DUF1802 family protein [Gemmataceae bacterium]|nr:DUF1802 family protein [Gemmataceae bacterium]